MASTSTTRRRWRGSPRQNPTEIEDDRIRIAGQDVTEAIRTAEIDRVVSSVARHDAVREVLRERQRALAEAGDAIMEGRDIGAVVVPHADVKVYLVADASVRAARREAERPGIGADALATDLRLRDERDAQPAPGRAPDARDDRHDRPRDRRGRPADRRRCRSRTPGHETRGDPLVGHREDAPRGRDARHHARSPVTAASAIPREGGAVLAVNHVHWIDIPVVGALCPRRIVYLAKARRTRSRSLGPFIGAMGTLAVRRGESDREAVRLARQAVRQNELLGMFVEGTRQRSGEPGEAKPGAAMVAIQEGVPVLPAAIYGQPELEARLARADLGRVGRADAVRRAPAELEGLQGSRRPRSRAEIRRLWEFLAEMHRLDRPAGRRRGAPSVPSKCE